MPDLRRNRDIAEQFRAMGTKAEPCGGTGEGRVTVMIKHSVALVDDDPNVRRAVKRVLDTMDFYVSPFESAEDFLACMAQKNFHCLLLDLQLRGLSGLDLYQRLQAEERTIPVIFISASPDALRTVKATAGGDSEVLLKPLDAEILRATIDRAIRQQVRV